MKGAIRGGLGQNAAQREVGSINLDGKGKFSLKKLKDWRKSEGMLKRLEGRLRLVGPSKLDTFSSEGCEGGSERGVVENEFPVEVSKA